MLVLSRRPGDAILIDGGIRIIVLATDSGSVRLGIEAPGSVGIVREEIIHRMGAEQGRASGIQGEDSDGLGGRRLPPDASREGERRVRGESES